MRMAGVAAVCAAVMLLTGQGLAETLSEPVLVRLFPDRNLCWETVFTNEVPLVWDWDWITNTAVTAELRIDGMNGSVKTNFTTSVSSWIWRAFETDVPVSEDAYTLTLTFFGGDETVLGSLSSRLAVVRGAFGCATVDPDPASVAWSRVRDNAVIPYDAGWMTETSSALSEQLVIAKVGGYARTFPLANACGYFGWQLKPSDWGTGVFDLTLSFPGTATNVWLATLTRLMEGTIITIQ